MLASVAYICGGTQYQFERLCSRQVLFNARLVIFHMCSFHNKVHDMYITHYKEAWSMQARNGDALWISRGTTRGHACNSEVVIERYRSKICEKIFAFTISLNHFARDIAFLSQHTICVYHNSHEILYHDISSITIIVVSFVHMYTLCILSRHTAVCQRPRKQKKMCSTQVLFTSTTKLPNSAFCISKTTKLIFTKFIYFLPYIYTTLHIKFEENCFSSS